MTKLLSHEELMKRYNKKQNSASKISDAERMYAKINREKKKEKRIERASKKLEPQKINPKDLFYIVSEQGDEFYGVLSFHSYADALILITRNKSASIIHTGKEIQRVSDILNYNKKPHLLLKIESPDEIGTFDELG